MVDPVAALEQALYEARSGWDAIPATELALAALRVECGELPADELEPVVPVCTCPPDLRDRGGFRSSCPACGPPAPGGN